MFDPSSFADPTPLAHADVSRDVFPRGSTSQVSFSPSCLSKGVGAMKAEPENSIITMIYLVKKTNLQQSIHKENVK
ncbi:hypothetical protein TNCV_284301 [Trichonephila clavipes]|uniref:Uncharacterized protein n=1 Tax=Trichonephila clavipes TaxID=2585209 RepID=A0A8X6SNM2_TRICX|nr:hypothetical protein TNCV_284301 [Trichonephila clavipes]